MKGFRDIADFSEDERIRRIGNACRARPGQLVAFVTDDEPDKPERYIRKLAERFPDVKFVDKSKGPVANTVTVRMRKDG